MSELIDALATILAPQGIKTVTTGSDEIGAFLHARFGTLEPEQVQVKWRAQLERIAQARAIVLGVPMDAGAGFERGSFKGPLGLRAYLLATQGASEALEAAGVVDIGDVRVNPQLVDDSYYDAELLARVRASRGQEDASLPVAPHSILRAALEALARLNPDAPVLVLGGDHSISRVPVEVLAAPDRNPDDDLGIVHFDAHTDLLDRRDGVPHNFATWAYWANEALGRGGRLQQLGIRVSGHTAAHWKEQLGVDQFWSERIAREPEAVLDQLTSNLEAAGVSRVYVSNDIDATDPRWAAATGTMEHDGLEPAFVTRALAHVAKHFEIVGADLVEVAPPLKWHVPGEPRRTIQTGAHYLLAQLEALLGQELDVRVPAPAPATREQLEATPAWH